MPHGSPSSDSLRGGSSPALGEAILGSIEAHLRQREIRREELYQQARRLRRLAQVTMTRLHLGAAESAELTAVRTALADLCSRLRREGRADEPLVHDALQEAVEASLLGAIVARGPLPGPADLDVEPEPYLLGLGDVVGEVRRLVLERLGEDDVDGAERYLRLMEELTQALLRFDTSRAIVQLKPKQDQARTLVERTRGEVVMARFLARARPSPPGGGGDR
jgi:translin